MNRPSVPHVAKTRSKAAWSWIALVAGLLLAAIFQPEATRAGAAHKTADDAESPNARLELGEPIGGSVYGVGLVGDVAWMGVGPRLMTFDVSDPAAPVRIGTTGMLPEIVRDVAVHGDHVFVVMGGLSGENGSIAYLWVFDANTPAAPAVVGKLSADTNWVSLSIAEDVGCLADGAAVSLVDVRDPAAPAVMGSLVSDAGLCRMLTDDRMVVDGSDGLALYDVAAPGAPDRVDAIEGVGWVLDFEVIEDTLFVVADEDGGIVKAVSWTADGLDLASDDVGIENAGSLGADGSRLAVADYYGGEIRLFDATDPIAPEPVGAGDVPDLAADMGYAVVAPAVAMAGGTIVLAAPYSGLCALDFSDPADPSVGTALVGPSYANDVVVHAGTAYVSTFVGGVWVVDVRDPDHPVAIGRTLPAPVGDRYANLGALAWADDRLYALDFSGDVGRLLIFDASDPHVLAEIGSIDLPSHPGQVYDMAVVAGRAFVPNGGKVSIIDVADAVRPRILNTLDLGGATSVAVRGNHLYAAIESRGLDVFDVADPARPAHSASLPSKVRQITLAGDHLYASVLDRPASLRVYSLADPALPEPVATIDDFGTAGGPIAVADGFAIRDVGYGYELVYVGDLPRLTPIHQLEGVPSGTLFAFSAAFGLAAEGRHAWAAQGEAGLLTLRRADSVSQPTDTAPPFRVFLPAIGAIAPATAEAACRVTHVALVLDTSRDRGGGSPLLADAAYAAALAEAARTFVRAVDLSRVGVSVLRYDRQAALLATGGDPVALSAPLASLALGSGRRIDVALAAAGRTLRAAGAAGREAAIVLVAAGAPDDGTAGRAFAEARTLRAAGVGVTTVAFGGAADAELLAALATRPDQARVAPTGDTLASALDVVGRSVSDCPAG